MTAMLSSGSILDERPIMVTGASGFVGWNAVRYFAARRHGVVATYRTLPHYLHNVDGVEVVQLDLLDDTSVQETVARFQPRFVLHCAALARPQRDTDERQLEATNVAAVMSLARIVAVHHIPIVYLSTDLVYPAGVEIANDRTEVAPQNPYAHSKFRGESAVQNEAEDWIILRTSLMYGDGNPRSRSFTQFLDACWRAGKPAPVFTDQFRPFLFVGDLLEAVELVMSNHEEWNRIHLCGGPERLSRSEFAVRYARIMGVDPVRFLRPVQVRELDGYIGGASDIDLDTTSLRAIGWVPRTVEEVYADRTCKPRTRTDDGFSNQS